MMHFARPLCVVLFAAAILGGLFTYLSIAETELSPPGFEAEDAQGKFRVVLTLPFDAGSSDFAIQEESPALLLRLDGRDLKTISGELPKGLVTIEDVQGIKIGKNEFYVEAHPKEDLASKGTFSLDAPDETVEQIPVPIRIQVFRDGNLVGEKTSWSEPGVMLATTVTVEIRREFQAE